MTSHSDYYAILSKSLSSVERAESIVRSIGRHIVQKHENMRMSEMAHFRSENGYLAIIDACNYFDDLELDMAATSHQHTRQPNQTIADEMHQPVLHHGCLFSQLSWDKKNCQIFARHRWETNTNLSIKSGKIGCIENDKPKNKVILNLNGETDVFHLNIYNNDTCYSFFIAVHAKMTGKFGYLCIRS